MTLNRENPETSKNEKDIIIKEISSLKKEVKRTNNFLNEEKRINIGQRLASAEQRINEHLQSQEYTQKEKTELEWLKNEIVKIKRELENNNSIPWTRTYNGIVNWGRLNIISQWGIKDENNNKAEETKWDDEQWDKNEWIPVVTSWWNNNVRSIWEIYEDWKDFISKQVSYTLDKDKWGSEPAKNTFRSLWLIAASVWIWALLYKWYKTLFWEEKTWDKENNESNDKPDNSDETEENQSDKGNKNNDEEDEDLETNETTDEDIKRFHKIADTLYEKDRHEHQYYNNSDHIWAICRLNKERIERAIHCYWTINNGGKPYFISFDLKYNKDSNKFYYRERDSESREIKWSELRELLKDIEDQLKWNYRRLKRLAY